MEHVTEGVKILLGNPKKAIRKLALPMIVGLSAQMVYNIVDAIWVSGLGADALAAVGFFFPFFFLLMALATGISVGASSAISRKIGSRNKRDADSVAIHSLIIGGIVAIAVSLPFLIFIDKLFAVMGAGEVTKMATAYARILFAGSIFIFFSSIAKRRYKTSHVCITSGLNPKYCTGSNFHLHFSLRSGWGSMGNSYFNYHFVYPPFLLVIFQKDYLCFYSFQRIFF